jgi:hypothetical protein
LAQVASFAAVLDPLCSIDLASVANRLDVAGVGAPDRLRIAAGIDPLLLPRLLLLDPLGAVERLLLRLLLRREILLLRCDPLLALDLALFARLLPLFIGLLALRACLGLGGLAFGAVVLRIGQRWRRRNADQKGC